MLFWHTVSFPMEADNDPFVLNPPMMRQQTVSNRATTTCSTGLLDDWASSVLGFLSQTE